MSETPQEEVPEEELPSDGDDVLDGVDPPTDEELEAHQASQVVKEADGKDS